MPPDEPNNDDATRVYRPYESGPRPEDMEKAPGPPDPFAPPPPPADPFRPPPPVHPAAPPPPPQGHSVAPPQPSGPPRAAPGPPPATPAPPPVAPPLASPPSAATPRQVSPVTPPDPFRPMPAPAPVVPPPQPATTADPFVPPPPRPATPADPFAPSPNLGQNADPFAPAPPRSATPADPFAPPSNLGQNADPFAPAPLRQATPPDPFAPASPAATPAPVANPVGIPDPFAPPPPRAEPEHRPDAPRQAPPQAPIAPPAYDPFAPPKSAAAYRDKPSFDSGVAHQAYPQAAPTIGGLDVSDGRLAGHFASVLALILHLRTLQDFGDASGLRGRAESLLDQAVASARSKGYSGADISEAEFCVVAFFDESILGSNWAGRDAWAANPLQLSRYERYDAGEAFFDRLRELFATNGREEVMEVYYLCLSLGYKGRYQIHGREVLRQLIDELQGRLGRVPGGAPGVLAERAVPRGPRAEAEAGGIPTWALFLGAALLVALLYIGLSFSISRTATEVASDIQSLPVQAE